MSDQEATNPVAEEEANASTEAKGVAEEAQAQGDDQTNGDEQEGEGDEPQPDEDTEEIEDDEGNKHRVPKALKSAFLRQADYTRKTQEVAEMRRTVEARYGELQQQAEARSQTYEERVQLGLLDKQLEAFQSLDWNEYAQTYGANAAVAAQAQWRQLEQAKAQLNEQITAKEQDFVRSSEQATANALREAEQVLSREVQGYGFKLVQKVTKTASALGFSAEELRDSFLGADGSADVRTFKALARLAELEAENATLKAKQTKATLAEKQAKVQPANTVGQRAGQYKPGLDDSLPIEEWNRRFHASRKRG